MPTPTPVNGYCTVQELAREIFGPDDSAVPNAVDDQVLADAITDASRDVDNYCRRQFFATAKTLSLDAPVPYDRQIWFRVDVLAVQGASDGNGASIPGTEFYLWPRGAQSYAAAIVNANSSYGWFGGSVGVVEGAISIAASVGFVDRGASDPGSVQVVSATHRATLIKAAMLYRQRKPQSKLATYLTDADWQPLLDGYVRTLY